MSGTQDVVLAGGVQTMSSIPISSAMLAGQPLGFTTPFAESRGWCERFGDAPVNQFYAAQRIADHWNLSREDMEVFAQQSHNRALRAIAEGRFEREVVAYPGMLAMDETARLSTLEKMATLKPVDPAYPKITAAVSSSTCDAAAALLVVSEAALKRYGLTPRARIHHLSVRADDPIWHLTAPIPATAYALKRSGMRIEDIDLVEINEAFASVVMAWLKETGYPHERTNVNGGAIALGHPLGASGARLMTTMLHELERSGGRYGLQTMCAGGGQANVTIIERL
jgi:acetyl-CoA C-acetyltransferase